MERLLAAERLAYRDLFWQYDGHWNAAGNRFHAMALADRMASR